TVGGRGYPRVPVPGRSGVPRIVGMAASANLANTAWPTWQSTVPTPVVDQRDTLVLYCVQHGSCCPRGHFMKHTTVGLIVLLTFGILTLDLLLAPLALYAQPVGQLRRIGFLAAGSRAIISTSPRFEAFRDGL